MGGGARARLGGGRARRAGNKRRGTVAGKAHAGVLRDCVRDCQGERTHGGNSDPQGRGQRAIPRSEARVGRPERRGGGRRPPGRTGICGPWQQPVFRRGVGARSVCLAGPRALPLVGRGGCLSIMLWVQLCGLDTDPGWPGSTRALGTTPSALASPSSWGRTHWSCCPGGVG